jgi:hypothetical protein
LVAVSACGGDSTDQQIREAVRQFSRSLATGEGAETCGVLTQAYEKEFLHDPFRGVCPARVSRFYRLLQPRERAFYAQTEITQIEVPADDSAFACVRFPKDTPGFITVSTYTMEREDDAWRVAGQTKLDMC